MSYIVVSSLNTHLTKLHFLLKAYVVSRLVENEVKNRRYHRLCCHLSSKPLFKNVKQLDGCALWCSHWTLIRVAGGSTGTVFSVAIIIILGLCLGWNVRLIVSLPRHIAILRQE